MVRRLSDLIDLICLRKSCTASIAKDRSQLRHQKTSRDGLYSIVAIGAPIPVPSSESQNRCDDSDSDLVALTAFRYA